MRLLATASAPPRGKRAASARARVAVEAPLGWASASLQVMLQRAPTSEFPFKSVSRPCATVRSGAPLPAAAADRAGKVARGQSVAQRGRARLPSSGHPR